MKDKAVNIFFKIFILIFVTIGLALTTVNLFDVPTRFGITSEDPKLCDFLSPLSVKSCRSQNFAEVRNTVMYLRADIVPKEGSCLAKVANKNDTLKNIECPAGFTQCFSEEIRNESPPEAQIAHEQYQKISYYLYEKDCSRLLYFSAAGISLQNLLRIKESEWSVEQDLLL